MITLVNGQEVERPSGCESDAKIYHWFAMMCQYAHEMKQAEAQHIYQIVRVQALTDELASVACKSMEEYGTRYDAYLDAVKLSQLLNANLSDARESYNKAWLCYHKALEAR